MIRRDQFNGGDAPLQGDRVLRLGSIPANARILRAAATVEPIDARNTTPLFAETIQFFPDGSGDFGATRISAAGLAGPPAQPGWTEVDFHARRTLMQVTGASLDLSSLQIDMGGGAYVEINTKGAFKSPPPDTAFTISDPATATLPGLTVAKFKLTRDPNPAPNVASVTIRAVPSNVSLRAGTLAPFWTHLGDLTAPETSADFAAVLQAFLTTAPIENGFYNVPLTLHSDTLARLQVTFEIDLVSREPAAPGGLKEVVQVFDFSTLSAPAADVLSVEIPPNSRIVPAQTSARVRGAFGESRIVFPLPAGGPVRSDAAVEVSPVSTQAQPVSFETAVGATAFDLLLEPVDRTVRLRLDLHTDLDGKPDETSLLPGPVVFKLERDAAKPLNWVSVPLPAEFHFQDSQHVKRYWILLQSLEGKANWSAARAHAGELGTQSTGDGGLSWRSATVSPDFRPNTTGPFTAFFRLRRVPQNFQVPIELQIGKDDAAVRVKLDRFAPLGRVDFVPDVELAKGIRDYLAKTAVGKSACPETEHLANGDFKQWAILGDRIGSPSALNLPGGIAPTAVAVSPDGRYAYFLGGRSATARKSFLQLVDVLCDKAAPGSISVDIAEPVAFAVHPDGMRAYISTPRQIFVVDLASGEIVDSLSGMSGTVASMAFNSDGTRLYVVVQTTTPANQSQLGFLDTPPPLASQAVSFFNPPVPASFVAVSPNGLLVVNANAIQLVDSANGAPLGAPVSVSNPGAIAVSPDGARAFVATGGDAAAGITASVTVVDLSRGSVFKTIPMVTPLRSLAATPHGDRVYLVNAAPLGTVGNTVQYIPIGVRQPAEWAPSGQVGLSCASAPSRIAVKLDGESASASLSQVVPVSGSCPYDFRFLGSAKASGAVAEVFWLSQCQPLKTETVPIAIAGELVQHQVRLLAPDGAVQAEVRFRVPDHLATIAMASFGATAEALQNGSLVLQAPGRIANWTLAPQPAAGFAATASGSGLQLLNRGAAAVDLSQSVPVKNRRNFALEVRARNTGQPPQTNPRVELRWLDANGQPTGEPSVVEAAPGNFGLLTAKGAVPSQAAQAEVHLLIPPSSVLQADKISLRFPDTISVPVTFIAHAPGELTVSDLNVAFEPLPPPTIPPPDRLCAPTPPDLKPGELPEGCGVCCSCGSEQKMIAPHPAVTHAGQAVTEGACTNCGTNIVRFGGTPAIGVPLVRMTLLPTPALVPTQAFLTTDPVALTVINGIGAKRAQELQTIGIVSVQDLAAANPQILADNLTGLHLTGAGNLIEQARKLL